MIEFTHVKKRFGEQQIFSDFSLHIARGEFITVVGTSGCGKTTMLRMINGLVVPDEGEVRVGDELVSQTDIVRLRRSIGYCIQGSVLFPHMTVEENVLYVPRLEKRMSRSERRKKAAGLLERVGLKKDMLSRYPSGLSGGQQQRVAIARALACEGEIMLMDEPFGAVDSITRSMLQQEISELHKTLGLTILFVTHDMGEALRLGTKVLVLHKGQIRQFASPEEIAAKPADSYVSSLLASSQPSPL